MLTALLLAASPAAGLCQTRVDFANADIAGATAPPRQIVGTVMKPAGAGPFPAVVLLHSCGGVQPHVADDWPRYLAGIGYLSITIDSFGSRGLGGCPNALHPANGPPGAYLNAYREITRDAFGALDYLAARGDVQAEHVAVIGFSLGTNVINSFLIHQPKRPGNNFAAAIGLYGRCHDLARHPTPPTPLMEIAAELDPAHVGSCRAVESQIEVHVLPGAYHSWDDQHANGRFGQAGELMRYDYRATTQSRELVRDFLARTLHRSSG